MAIPQPIGSPVDPEDPLNILTQGMQQEAGALQEDATRRMQESTRNSAAIEVSEQAPRVITNETIASLYDKVTNSRIVQYLPPGSKVLAKTKNVRTQIDPVSKKVAVIVDDPEVKIPFNTDPNQAVRAAMDNAADPNREFNIDTEMAKLKNLRGNELATAVTNLMANINVQLTKETQRLSKLAEIESGYASAKAALQRSVEIDALKGFTQATYQTHQAQQLANSALSASQALTNAMVLKDPKVARLKSHLDNLTKMEGRIALRQIQREEKLDEKLSSITQPELANFKIVYGSSGSDEKDKITIAARRDKDKVMHKVLQASPETIYPLLMDIDPKVRQLSLKIVEGWDRASNPVWSEQHPNEKTPTVKAIEEYIKDPIKLVDTLPLMPGEKKEDRAAIKIRLQQASPQELQQVYQGPIASLLSRAIFNLYDNSYKNAASWKSTETAPNQPLGQVINKVTQTNPKGFAPLGTVVHEFITDVSIKGADGKTMPFEQKVQILLTAMDAASANDFKSILMADPSGIRLKQSNEIKNLAARSHFTARMLEGQIIPRMGGL